MGLRKRGGLVKYAWHLGEGNRLARSGKAADAIRHFEHAVEVSGQHQLHGELLVARRNLAQELAGSGQLDECVRQLRLLVDESRESRRIMVLNETVETADLRHEAAVLLLWVSDAQEVADSTIDDLIDLVYRESQRGTQRGIALTRAGEVLADRGRRRAAAHSYVGAAEEYAKAGEAEDQARALWSAAVLYATTGAQERSRAALATAIDLFDQSGLPELAADCCFYLADLFRSDGEVDLAHQFYGEACNRFQSENNKDQYINPAMARQRIPHESA
ncbi:hypothetical protein ACIGKQ_21100 [Gordonia sp. NPDC062954]|uniref:hypothetical protein n=1 Tax=Gordonia sp. NPDC062954 TaxID=3364003 RepID=UPI0037C72EAB